MVHSGGPLPIYLLYLNWWKEDDSVLFLYNFGIDLAPVAHHFVIHGVPPDANVQCQSFRIEIVDEH